MAKIQQHNFLNTVHEVFTDAKRAGVLHLYAEGDSFSGRTIGIDGRQLFHFGTTGYLGLEQDPRLKRAAIRAIERYGTQFPLSKSYISNPLYRELEELVTTMYDNPVVITKNSTLGHMGVIPSAVGDRDAIILDHQVHWSVQSAAKPLKARSVPIEMIRHNHLGMLEDKIKKYRDTKQHIWYMADGIYSMYGDYAPIGELMELARKYPQLHLYFDDVHGMGWTGRHGTGPVLEALGELPENVLLFGTLSKTFGASGAVLACSNARRYDKIRTFGGPLTFSAQLEPASVGAAIAAARIHLSGEIYELQRELRQRIELFNQLLAVTELPLIDRNPSPVFYIGTGMPKTGYNFVKRLMKEGFFVNLGIFPAVPVKNTGVRITISRHNRPGEIKALVEAMVHHFPLALAETGTTADRVCHAFKLEPVSKDGLQREREVTVELRESINEIDREEWNRYLGGQGVYDWDGLRFLEQVFQGHEAREHNWTFRYVVIRDREGQVLLMTFLTLALWKDDLLAEARVSEALEVERRSDPYHMCSEVLSMGCLFTEGDHLYWDADHPEAHTARAVFLETMEKLEMELGAKMVVLRDFADDTPWNTALQGHGFLRVRMPESCTVDLGDVADLGDYLSRLSARNRRHFRKDVQPYREAVTCHIWSTVPDHLLVRFKGLFEAVHARNRGLNTFPFPDRVFEGMNSDLLWEFIVLSPVGQVDRTLGVMFCYRNGDGVYVPAFVGLDYDGLETFATYRLLLLHTIDRAIALGFPRIDFGMTASFEKRKLGAVMRDRFAYLQTRDNFILETLGVMEGQH